MSVDSPFNEDGEAGTERGPALDRRTPTKSTDVERNSRLSHLHGDLPYLRDEESQEGGRTTAPPHACLDPEQTPTVLLQG